MSIESPERNGLIQREWKWCQSKEQRTCDEVCKNNLEKGKCIQNKSGCRVKPKEKMTEEVKVRLQAYRKPRKRPSRKKEHREYLLRRISEIGAKKLSIISFDGSTGSFITEIAINHWIQRRSIPHGRVGRIAELVTTLTGIGTS